jgi:exodeoxyribonuclease VII large subunit
LNELTGRSLAAVTKVLSRRNLEITAGENRLAALNPKSVLNRGYSITVNKQTGRVVRSLDDVQLDDSLLTELAGENFVESRVTKKVKEEHTEGTNLSDASN